MSIFSDRNIISIQGEFALTEMPRLLAAMHSTTEKLGYKDFTLDFSKCTSAFASSMISVAAKAQQYWKQGIDIKLIVPTDEKLGRLFVNSNWANFIDPRDFVESRYKGFEQVPLLRFTDATEQQIAVDRVLDILLAALTDFRRSDLIAIEWALNEVTDNVINHAESNVGGFLQVTNFKKRQLVEFAVCDVGIGIPASFRKSKKENKSDREWLDSAIREGVTRDSSIGQGNGLFGTWRITQRSEGEFRIYSGHGGLVSSLSRGLHVAEETVFHAGTLVVARIGYKNPIPLAEALTFKGKSHEPLGFIEQKYVSDEKGNIRFKLKSESEGFGSRAAGRPVRGKLQNLARFTPEGRILVDMSGIPLVSSSYADEVFGKLFAEMGPVDFSRTFEFIWVDALVKQLIDKAIYQRMLAPPIDKK